MTVRELRDRYLRFFESKGHAAFPSGSLVPYDVTGRLDESLLFNGAGMIQFKPYFRGVAEPENRRLATAQKCVRTGDIDEVGDLSHLTFFEMMGNFSFGDYFKAEAIAYSWEFLTSPEWLALDPRRLSFTVHETDDEAFAEWSKWLSAAGIDPATRVFRLGEETNYWPAGAFSNGPPGPCGPNSEMFYWVGDGPPPSGHYTVEDYLRDDEAKNWLEIWNDVFIQYEWQGQPRDPARPALGFEKLGMPDLPFRSIDTGMGLERTAAALGGHKSVYDTDVFAPILAKIADLRGGELPAEGDEARAVRIVADHIRTACFCIADGILPGNSGRGYVLRRLIRRAVLKGQRVLGFDQPFFHEVYEGVAEAMGGHYTELIERRDVIVQTLRNEEALFRRTLAQGSEMLAMALKTLTSVAGATVLSGDVAFRLYDTFGFPLEVTQELAAEAGIEVDVEGYEQAMAEAQDRSRATDRESVYGGVGLTIVATLFPAESGDSDGRTTVFTGYEELYSHAKIVAVVPEPSDDGSTARGNLVVALDRTPFYAESGGQVGDLGWIRGEGFEGRVTDVVRQDGVYVHSVEPTMMPVAGWSGLPFEEAKTVVGRALTGLSVIAVVDEARRARIRRNHTATHLLHASLRRILGTHVTQAGSYVGPDRLRFDFTHGKALSESERAEVERMVNEAALRNIPVGTYVDIPVAEAKARGAMALFGEKYGDRVRMVEVGEFSRELCGGTHVASTGEVGLFRIVAETSAASGIRRIEALTGEGAYEWVLEETRRVHDAAALLKTVPQSLPEAVQRLLEQLRDERRRREKAETASVSGAGSASEGPVTVKGVRLLAQAFGEIDPKIAANALDNAVAADPGLVALGAVVAGEKVQFSCKCGPAAVAAGAHAGNLVREVAKIAGGGGGGRPEFATAGGREPGKVAEALAAAQAILEGQLP